jgi:hypothetical protein
VIEWDTIRRTAVTVLVINMLSTLLGNNSDFTCMLFYDHAVLTLLFFP